MFRLITIFPSSSSSSPIKILVLYNILAFISVIITETNGFRLACPREFRSMQNCFTENNENPAICGKIAPCERSEKLTQSNSEEISSEEQDEIKIPTSFIQSKTPNGISPPMAADAQEMATFLKERAALEKEFIDGKVPFKVNSERKEVNSYNSNDLKAEITASAETSTNPLDSSTSNFANNETFENLTEVGPSMDLIGNATTATVTATTSSTIATTIPSPQQIEQKEILRNVRQQIFIDDEALSTTTTTMHPSLFQGDNKRNSLESNHSPTKGVHSTLIGELKTISRSHNNSSEIVVSSNSTDKALQIEFPENNGKIASLKSEDIETISPLIENENNATNVEGINSIKVKEVNSEVGKNLLNDNNTQNGTVSLEMLKSSSPLFAALTKGLENLDLTESNITKRNGEPNSALNRTATTTSDLLHPNKRSSFSVEPEEIPSREIISITTQGTSINSVSSATPASSIPDTNSVHNTSYISTTSERSTSSSISTSKIALPTTTSTIRPSLPPTVAHLLPKKMIKFSSGSPPRTRNAKRDTTNIPAPQYSNTITKNEIQQMNSEERAEKFSQALDKFVQVVNIVGQMDSYVSDRLKTSIKKLAKLCDDEE